MYEEQTFDQIIERQLKRIKDMDTKEGSLLYNATAIGSWELAILYIELDFVLQCLFADTASRPYLIRRTKERGIIPTPATAAIAAGEFNCDVPIGSRFSLGDDTTWFVIKQIEGNRYQLQCEQLGIMGNKKSGDLKALEYIKDLEYARLTELLVPAQDEEETEHLRQRYFDTLTSQAFGGNIADYKTKVNQIAGVGGVKVYPVWNGGGTVKLTIINSDYQVASETLVATVQDIIDPPENSGKGYGIAPIGHQVTVVSVKEHWIDIKVQLVYQSNSYCFDMVKESIYQVLDAYFLSLNKVWADTEQIVVRKSQIESRILDIAGILDVTEVWINEKTQNLVLSSDEIAIRGTIIEGN